MRFFKSHRRYIIVVIAVTCIVLLTFHFHTELIKDTVLSDEEIMSTFKGNYFINFGLGGSQLSLGDDRLFMETIWRDTGPPFSFDKQGEFIVEHSQIRLTSKDWVKARYFIPIRWGKRKYLIEAEKVSDFCERVKDGPQFGDLQFFLIQESNENMSVDGLPISPDGKPLCS